MADEEEEAAVVDSVEADSAEASGDTEARTSLFR